MFRVSIESAKGKTQIHDLALGSYTLGRGLGCDIRLPGKLAARRHAVLTLGPDDVSLNGIQNNRLQYQGETLDRVDDLLAGTEVTLGEVRLVVLDNPYRKAAASKQTAPNEGLPASVMPSLPDRLRQSSARESAAYVAEKRTLQLGIYQELDFDNFMITGADSQSSSHSRHVFRIAASPARHR